MSQTLKIGTRILDFSHTLIMGVLNVTPDSFYDGGKYDDVEVAKKQALLLQKQGADILDIGGESSRPGSKKISAQAEINRVVPVIKAIKDKIHIPISIDSYKPEVIEAALDEGATIVNDITGLSDKNTRKLVANKETPVIIMHMQGSPQNMQKEPKYDDIVQDIYRFFKQQSEKIINDGLSKSKIIIDPGIGFGKTVEHNLEIIRRLDEFKSLGYPLLIGTSRKSFIGAVTDTDVGDRLPATIASVIIAVYKGVNIVRVHDVGATKQAINLIDAVEKTNG